MKIKKAVKIILSAVVCCLFFGVFALCGCMKSREYEFVYDVSEIIYIKIADVPCIENAEEYLKTCEILVDVDDVKGFIEEFKTLKFYPTYFGDPPSNQGKYEIFFIYKSGEIEGTNWTGQHKFIKGKPRYGRQHCGFDEFTAFVENWL